MAATDLTISPYTGQNGRDTAPVNRLNLGCGRKHRSDAINVDRVASVEPDIVHDLDVRPWPFEDDRFVEVSAIDVIEHCADVVATMSEIHRVCRDGAIVHIAVPHFSCANAFVDPTHRHFFGWSTFDYFTSDHEIDFYLPARFKWRRRQIVFMPSLLNKLVWRIANRWPVAYETRWAWIFPAWFLSLELQVLK